MAIKEILGWFRKRRQPGGDAGSGEPAASRGLEELPVLPGPPAGGGAGTPRHYGDLWAILQDIAREEDLEVFSRKSVADHAAESLEGKKDVDRWLNAYLRRLKPDHPYRFPAHHQRHRGYCLIPRQYPSGTRWQCFHEKTFLKLRLPDQPSKAELIAALDRWLESHPES
ncbi:MAG: hypothetical protein HY717_22835 [Planctomycetes bacterium]|nr:hypothetical protein [Planctomycetota bacterium]